MPHRVGIIYNLVLHMLFLSRLNVNFSGLFPSFGDGRAEYSSFDSLFVIFGLFLSDFQWCCLAVQASLTVMKHVASVESSSSNLHGTFRDLFVLPC